jgi:pectate lyase
MAGARGAPQLTGMNQCGHGPQSRSVAAFLGFLQVLVVACGASEGSGPTNGGVGGNGGVAGAAAASASGGRSAGTAGANAGVSGNVAVNGGNGIGGGAGISGIAGMSGDTGTSGVAGAGGGAESSGSAGAGGSGGGAGAVGAPNLYATSAGLVEVYVNGASLGKSTNAGALLAVAATLKTGAENVIAIRATKGSANKAYLLAELDGAFGKAGTSTQWKAKPASTADEQTGSAWATAEYGDNGWAAATDVQVSPTAAEMVRGPAHGVWTSNASDSAALFRMRFYIPASWDAAKPYGFGAAVTGGAGGSAVTVSTAAALVAAVAGDAPKVIQISGTIDFTGSEGATSASGCYVAQCPSGASEYILGKLGACDGKTTFDVTFDSVGLKPLAIGSNKTLIGVGANATIKGKGLIFNNGVNNVVVRNLTITNINPQVVWGGDALSFVGAKNIWLDHNRVSLVGRQFIVTHNGANTGITLSYNDFDGSTPYSATCNGAHYYVMLNLGAGDEITAHGNWIHNTSGRAPHAGGSAGAAVYMHFINDYFMTVPGHAVDASTGASLLFEGTYFQNVTTPFMADAGSNYAPVASNAASTSSACTAAIGRSCVANATSSNTVTTFPLAQAALTAMGSRKSALVQAYPANEVPYSVPHLAGPGHI